LPHLNDASLSASSANHDLVPYRLLRAFQSAFDGHAYIHRNQGIGNSIATHLYEDLLEVGRSPRFIERVTAASSVVNTPNRIIGRAGRRGDGTFGEIIPGQRALREPGFAVSRGPIATLEIGTEVKIVAKAMAKQIDRVMNDLVGQAHTFETQTRNAIRVAIVGVNFADTYIGYEKDRTYPALPAPSKEAPRIVPRIEERVRPSYDELLILRFKATNAAPFPFEWVDPDNTERAYGAALVRISRSFEDRF
jgi:hypothetical protein